MQTVKNMMGPECMHAPDNDPRTSPMMSWCDGPSTRPWPLGAPSVRCLSCSPLEGHEVLLCLFDLDDPRATTPSWLSCLSPDEQNRARRFKFDLHAQRHRAGRAMARHLLASWAERPVNSLPWAQGPHGKPHLSGCSGPHFNLSHSGRWALLALSATLDVGVDLELDEHRQHLAHLSTRILSDTEVQTGNNTACNEPAGLLRTWVRKEACLKAMGLGLTLDMPELTLACAIGVAQGTAMRTPTSGATEESKQGRITGWQDLDLPADCPALACLAWCCPATS